MIWLLLPMFSFWWVLLTVAFFGWVIVCEEMEKPFEAFGVLLFYVILASLFGDFFSVVKGIFLKGWLYVGVGVPLYIVIGFAWGVFRYWWEQSLQVAKYNEKKISFLHEHGIQKSTAATEVPEELLVEWMNIIGVSQYSRTPHFRQFFHAQRKRVMNWMSWWWLSMLSFFLRDLILRAYTIILNKTRFIFENIDNRVWGSTNVEFDRMSAKLDAIKATDEEETRRQRETRGR